jgi:hypothetical protein
MFEVLVCGKGGCGNAYWMPAGRRKEQGQHLRGTERARVCETTVFTSIHVLLQPIMVLFDVPATTLSHDEQGRLDTDVARSWMMHRPALLLILVAVALKQSSATAAGGQAQAAGGTPSKPARPAWAGLPNCTFVPAAGGAAWRVQEPACTPGGPPLTISGEAGPGDDGAAPNGAGGHASSLWLQGSGIPGGPPATCVWAQPGSGSLLAAGRGGRACRRRVVCIRCVCRTLVARPPPRLA